LTPTETHDAAERSRRMLRSALGPQVCRWLDDDNVAEVMLNPDGRLWLDRLDIGLFPTEARMEADDAERVIRLAAHSAAAEVHRGRPRVSAELPGGGERFEGLLPPVVKAPAFSVRKPARRIWRLADYVASGVMTALQAETLAQAVAARRTVLVAGAAASGKTTLVNALLAEMELAGDRLVIIEDVRELRCAAENLVALRTWEDAVSLRELVRSALRLRPDRIVVGEVRGAEALDLLKAWGTGHPGGVGTLHAGSAHGALLRLEQLVQEAVEIPPRGLIAETVDLVAVLDGRGSRRRLAELAWVEGLDDAGQYRLAPAAPALSQAA
jgi:P-type conjugative transfer ATPase TrbB